MNSAAHDCDELPGTDQSEWLEDLAVIGRNWNLILSKVKIEINLGYLILSLNYFAYSGG